MDDAFSSATIMLVDDDARLTAALSRVLSLRGYRVTVAPDAGRALAVLDEEVPNAVVLDVMMPGVDGLRLCKLIRERLDVPILMLTALDSVPSRVAGLEAGADDYLVKPFATEELLARLAALLRRSRPKLGQPRQLKYADLVLDARTWKVTRNDAPVTLTTKEFRVLEALMRAPEEVLTREQILAAAWGDEEAAESNVVDVHVASLRQKLEAGGRGRVIQTIRGVGYILKQDQ
jgi:two-component system response regulator MprA